MPNEMKEIDVFQKYTKNNKSKIVLISLLIAVVVFLIAYFSIKSVMTYTVTFNTNGGTVVEPYKLKFLERVELPKIKKSGHYLVRWHKDNARKSTFTSGSRIWRDTNLCAEWEEGFALVLNYAELEKNKTDLPLDELKLLYEEFFKDGSTVYLPEVYNVNKDSEHFGERLLWFEDEACTKGPFMEKSYVLNGENIPIYGKWFDTDKSKFQVDENGVLQRYLGYSTRIILPNNIVSIRDVNSDTFNSNRPSGWVENDADNFSVFCNVASELEIIYINAEMTRLGECSFRDCVELEAVIFLGENLKEIGPRAFQSCVSLKNIELPNGIETIGEYSFYNTTKLESVSMPESVIRVKNSAFRSSGLKEVSMSKVSFIEELAFAYCTKLKLVTLSSPIIISTDALTTNKNVFYMTANASGSLVIKVPANLLEAYKSTSRWSDYSDYYVAI